MTATRTVNDLDLPQILKEHRDWLYRKGGRRADLSGVDLSRTDLTGVDLRLADLSFADLRASSLRRANLSAANLTWAKLAGADLTGANLSNAIIRGASFYEAVLRETILCGADLHGVDFREADFTKAYLAGTALDDDIRRRQREFVRQCPPLRTGGRIVYRAARSFHVGNTIYVPGHTYVAPVLSAEPTAACHPGIYAASLEWMRREYPNARLVRCYVRDGDWFIAANGAIRCKRIRVLNYIDGL